MAGNDQKKKDVARKIKEAITEKYDVETEGGSKDDFFDFIEENLEELEETQEEAVIRLGMLEDIRKMRTTWSNWLLASIIAILALNYVFIFFLGFKLIEIDEEIVPYFVGDSVLKIVGLAIIIVGFLFNKDSFPGSRNK